MFRKERRNGAKEKIGSKFHNLILVLFIYVKGRVTEQKGEEERGYRSSTLCFTPKMAIIHPVSISPGSLLASG